MKRLLLVFLPIACVTLAAQPPDPSKLPLVQQADLQYLGGFRVPQGALNGDDLSYGGMPMAFNPANNSLFIGSMLNKITEISIPTPLNSTDAGAMPVAAFLQPSFVDPTDGHLGKVTGGTNLLGGLLVHSGRLIVSGFGYYDATGAAHVSHAARSLTFTTANFSGWSSVWRAERSGFVAGYMADLPIEWQSRLGGPALTGQCCLPIITRTSFGPSAFAFDPSQVGQAKVTATPLLYYDALHPTLGPWEGANPTFSATTTVNGVVVIPGTRSALFFGRNGLGAYCYGDGTSDKALANTPGKGLCYDPLSSSKGQHGYPYRYQIWAYDLNDFAAVKAGKKQPWDVKPYGVWALDQLSGEVGTGIGGLGYDSARQTIYVSQLNANRVGCCGSLPVVHAFTVKR